ncbi:MAG: serine/threonine protein kinase [Acidobacteria bacterium]|nr:MAG: serine/threonine protein kinase [Acidobacteriota bacterium]
MDEISRGGMGIVYRARDVKLNREVALKVLPPELVSDSGRKRRFVQEAQAAAALKHPNIAVVHEIDEDDGVTFIAMELVEGELLSDALKDGALPTERVLELAADIGRGLARAHESNIVHRDLKPGNVVLTRDGQPKIIDFGLAKLLERAGGAESEAATAIKGATEPGQVVGTVAYMSPEQARGEDIDARSDIFSFGIVLHELLTGTNPFDGPSAPELLSAIIREPHASLPHGSGTPHRQSLQRVIDRCLAKSPDDRFQQMSDVVASLDALRSTAPSAASSRRAWRVTVAAVCIASAALVGLWFARGAPSEVKWARETGLPELQDLVDADDYCGRVLSSAATG